MKAIPTPLQGLLVIEPTVFRDERGWFMESFNLARFNLALADHGQPSVEFVQDNQSSSALGVLRGLHFQITPHEQGKLVRVIAGRVWDVAVDIRADSITRGQWYGLELSAENGKQLWIPAGFAHGFLSLCDNSQVFYKTTDYYSPRDERSIFWGDPAIGIHWPLSEENGKVSGPIVALKDAQAPHWTS
jgi:dTDP-4-dehydrorhamnose 3,5-epimerase